MTFEQFLSTLEFGTTVYQLNSKGIPTAYKFEHISYSTYKVDTCPDWCMIFRSAEDNKCRYIDPTKIFTKIDETTGKMYDQLTTFEWGDYKLGNWYADYYNRLRGRDTMQIVKYCPGGTVIEMKRYQWVDNEVREGAITYSGGNIYLHADGLHLDKLVYRKKKNGMTDGEMYLTAEECRAKNSIQIINFKTEEEKAKEAEIQNARAAYDKAMAEMEAAKKAYESLINNN